MTKLPAGNSVLNKPFSLLEILYLFLDLSSIKTKSNAIGVFPEQSLSLELRKAPQVFYLFTIPVTVTVSVFAGSLFTKELSL